MGTGKYYWEVLWTEAQSQCTDSEHAAPRSRLTRTWQPGSDIPLHSGCCRQGPSRQLLFGKANWLAPKPIPPTTKLWTVLLRGTSRGPKSAALEPREDALRNSNTQMKSLEDTKTSYRQKDGPWDCPEQGLRFLPKEQTVNVLGCVVTLATIRL